MNGWTFPTRTGLPLLLGAAALIGVSGRVIAQPPPAAPLQLEVAGVVGSPRVLDDAGEPTALAAGDTVALGRTVVTDSSARAALRLVPGPKGEADRADLLIVGPGSKVVFMMATDPGGDTAPGAPLVAHLASGAWRAVVRGEEGRAAFSMKMGARTVKLLGADVAGTYAPETDDAMYVVRAGSIVIGAGKRRIVLKDGMVRTIEGGKVRGAHLYGGQWDEMVRRTGVPGVDVAQPAPLVAAKKPEQKPLELELKRDGDQLAIGQKVAPKPWEYDVDRDRYWNPDHNHWHKGLPPEDKVAGSAPATETGTGGEAEGDDAGDDAGERSAAVGELPTDLPTTRATVIGKSPTTGTAPIAPGAAPVRVRLQTSMGEIVLELDRAQAPISVKNFLRYVDRGFYDGTIFHRVIGSFMIQGGGFMPGMEKKDPGPGIANEWTNGLAHVRGSIAMARLGGRPDSATCQFFINVQDNARLDTPQPDGAGYAVFGKVVSGMSVVDAIRNVRTARRGPHGDVPLEPVVIEKAERVVEDEALE